MAIPRQLKTRYEWLRNAKRPPMRKSFDGGLVTHELKEPRLNRNLTIGNRVDAYISSASFRRAAHVRACRSRTWALGRDARSGNGRLLRPRLRVSPAGREVLYR